MYNGIGLTSVRGSATSGHVTRNFAHVSATRTAQIKSGTKDGPSSRAHDHAPAPKRANAEILLHNRKREVELKCLKLRETLEEKDGADPDAVERRVAELRESLLAKLPADGSGAGGGGRTGETHADAATKAHETAALKDALGISASYVGGSAFDRDEQERAKVERLAKRAAEDAERAELMAVLEHEQAREERQRGKEARRAERAERKAEKKRARHSRRSDTDSD